MTGRDLPPPSPFADDDGRPDPRLAAALTAEGAARTAEVVAALRQARVLVPVVAQLDRAGLAGGLVVDKEASTAVVAVRAPDGRAALPVFSGTDALAAWRPDARPVPAEGRRAAAAALQEGWEVLVVDPGGPAVLVPRPAVLALATGRSWVPAVSGGRVAAEVRAAVEACVATVPAVAQADVVPGRAAEVCVVLGLRPGLRQDELDGALRDVSAALSGSRAVQEHVDSLELRAVPRPA